MFVSRAGESGVDGVAVAGNGTERETRSRRVSGEEVVMNLGDESEEKRCGLLPEAP